MGWTYECERRSLKSFLADRCSGWENMDKTTGEKSVAKCLAHKYVMQNPGRGVLWKVMETTRYAADGTINFGPERWIAMDLVAYSGGRDGGWGYKDLEESMGVGDVSCPRKYLEMVPDPVCSKAYQCPKDRYGDNACKCSGCHGCGACWAKAWRERVIAHSDAKMKLNAFIKKLKVGDIIVLNKRCVNAGDQYTVTEVGRMLVASDGGCKFRIQKNQIDVDASLEVQGIDKEAV